MTKSEKKKNGCLEEAKCEKAGGWAVGTSGWVGPPIQLQPQVANTQCAYISKFHGKDMNIHTYRENKADI